MNRMAGVTVVRGSISQNSELFPVESRNKQCTCMSTVAICVSKVINLSTWDQNTIDQTLYIADEHYRVSIAELRRLHPNVEPEPYLLPEEVFSPVPVFGSDFQVEVKLGDFQGYLDGPDTLLQILQNFFEQYEHGVFTCVPLSVAVIRSNGKFSLFDSHQRDEFGRAAFGGRAILMTFGTLDQMVSAILQNFDCRNSPTFVIVPLIVTPLADDQPNVDVPQVDIVSVQNEQPGTATEYGMVELSEVESSGHATAAFSGRQHAKKFASNTDVESFCIYLNPKVHRNSERVSVKKQRVVGNRDELNLTHRLPGITVVRGSISQNSELFPVESRNKQCTCMSTVAICVSKVIDLASWDQNTIDQTIHIADEHYRFSIAKLRRLHPNAEPHPYLLVEEVSSPVSVLGHNFQFESGFEYLFEGFLHGPDPLIEKLHNFFEHYEHGVFTCQLLSLAVFQSHGQFSLFDSHQRDENGRAALGGKAFLMTFSNLQSMARVMLQNFECNNAPQFIILPLIVTPLVSNEPIVNVPQVSTTAHNDEPETAAAQGTKHAAVEIASNAAAGCTANVFVHQPQEKSALKRNADNSFPNFELKLSKRERAQIARQKNAERLRNLRKDSEFRRKEQLIDMQRKRDQRITESTSVVEESTNLTLKRQALDNPAVRKSLRQKELQQKREESLFKSSETRKNVTQKRNLMAGREFREPEPQKKRIRRAGPELRESEAQRKRDRRADPEFRESEVQRKRDRRTDPEFRESEAQQKRDRRADPEFRESEAQRRRTRRADPQVRESEAQEKRDRRTDPEFRESEAQQKRDRRADPEFRESEAQRRRTRRADPQVRESEAQEKRDRRTDPEFRESEAQQKRDRRADPGFCESEAQRRRTRRADPQVRESEAQEKRDRRTDPEFRESEAQQKRDRRADPEYRKSEAQRRRTRRADPQVRESEAQQKQDRRADPEFRESEVQQKRDRRVDPEFRESEAQRKRTRRADPQFRESEAQQKQDRRADPEFRELERLRDAQRQEMNRMNPAFCQTERQRNAQRLRDWRQNDFYRFREAYKTALQNCETEASRLKLAFIEARTHLPKYVCAFCDGLFFEHSVDKLNMDKLEEKLTEEEFSAVKDSMFRNTGYVHRACKNSISKGKVPKLAVVNGLQFPPIPACLKDLSPLEQRLVSPYIPFMQIRPLKPRSLNPQLGLKGSVVNIPVDVNDMIQVLPRQFDEMATVQIKLKRQIDHASDYMFETIKPSKVIRALNYLKDTTLYKEHDIRIDQSYLAAYDANDDSEVNFIVDSDDDLEPDCERTENGTERPIADPPSHHAEVENDAGENEDEVLLVDRDKELNDRIHIMAPGQGRCPVPWHLVPDLEELSFPTIFCGEPFRPASNISYSDRVKSELRRSDRRSCTPTRILFMAKKKLEVMCLSNINAALKKTKKTENLTARQVLDKATFNNLLKHDEGYRVLKNIRCSPAYMEHRKKELMAMLRQLGPPTFFLTVSAAEGKWPELIQGLSEISLGKKISIAEAITMSEAGKTDLIRREPVTCARYFDHKTSKLMWYLRQAAGAFQEHQVEESFQRVEIQFRGSPHEHVFLWLKDAPEYDSRDIASVNRCLAFIDRFLTCEFDEKNPYIAYVTHKHTHTCYKGNKYLKKCRFHFPIPPMRRTAILHPLESGEYTSHLKDDWKKICELCEDFFKKSQLVSFDDILKKLGFTEDRYVLAIRSSLKRPQVFLRRTSLEVAINSYNRDILNLFEANIDLQFILEEYGVASYVINYISKSEAGLSKMLREAADDIRHGYTNVRDKLRNISNVFLNANLMSAQEAVYQDYPLPMIKSSRACVYVNTAPIAERVRMMKKDKDLLKIDPESRDICMQSVHDKYSRRDRNLEHLCLAEFATGYNQVPRDAEDENDDADEHYFFKQRTRLKILRYRRYKEQVDPPNFYREQLCLFLPWRNETDEVEDCDHENKYRQNLDVIEKNRRMFSKLDDDVLDEALNVAANENRDAEEEEEEEFARDRLPPGQAVDVLDQGGQTRSTVSLQNRLTTPQRVDPARLSDMFRRLNTRQREIVMHVLHCVKVPQKEPLRLFISGSAGVGKTTVIHTIFQAITRHFDNMPGKSPDSFKVILCAYSGKAAYLIDGVTAHAAYGLVTQENKKTMHDLEPSRASYYREKFMDVELGVIDEISMLGSQNFVDIEHRSRELKGNDREFGGMHLVVVGQLLQLPPVKDSLIFEAPTAHRKEAGDQLKTFISENPFWKRFKIYELTEIMRQRNERDFITALNNLIHNCLTEEDIKLFKSREVQESEVPEEAIRLYTLNEFVDAYNEFKIKECPGEAFISVAKDSVLGKVSAQRRQWALNAAQKLKRGELKGLSHRITFKISIKYMITINLDVQDGLVNGAVGILRHITFQPNSSTDIDRIWLDFGSDEHAGKKARLALRDYMANEGIAPNLVPISRKTLNLSTGKDTKSQVVRQQFPTVCAEAMTFYKSQGGTYPAVCIDFRKCKYLTLQGLYVALSRVTKISGLYILGNFRVPEPSPSWMKIMKEMTRLRQAPLELAFWDLRDKTGLVLVYLNIQSFNAHGPDVIADDWYSRSDVLIFSEIWTLTSDAVDFPGFRVIYRCDSGQVRGPRGLLCFAKEGVHVTEITHRTRIGPNYGLYVVRFKVDSTLVITGYKSPRTPVSVFQTVMEELIPADLRVVILGDFNFNIINHCETCLIPFMSKHGFSPALPPETITTDLNTQIDVIFSNFELGRRGTYETYFSHHKPIYSELPR